MRRNVLVLSLMRGESLWLLGRFQEALDVYQELDPPSDEEHPEVKAAYYQLFAGALLWAGSVSAMACHGGRMEQLAHRLIALLERAELQGFGNEVAKKLREVEDLAPTAQAQLAAAEEFLLLVRLLSIKDPFERWEAIGESMRKRWPQGLSAVDAVREMRD